VLALGAAVGGVCGLPAVQERQTQRLRSTVANSRERRLVRKRVTHR
jgi:hypothetical protein